MSKGKKKVKFITINISIHNINHKSIEINIFNCTRPKIKQKKKKRRQKLKRSYRETITPT